MLKSTVAVGVVLAALLVAASEPLPACGAEPTPSDAAEVKLAAVQVLGYDKTDLPRAGYDPSNTVVRYIERAARDGAQLLMFPEYLLGRELAVSAESTGSGPVPWSSWAPIPSPST